MRNRALVLALGLIAFGSSASCLQAQVRCLSNADTASTFIADVKWQLSNVDSAQLARSGLPYLPNSVTLVTDEAVCGAALDAFSAAMPSGRVEEAYLIKADSAAYVLVPMTAEYRAHNTLIYMTNGFKVIFHVVDLD